MNLYGYCDGNPIGESDPSGLAGSGWEGAENSWNNFKASPAGKYLLSNGLPFEPWRPLHVGAQTVSGVADNVFTFHDAVAASYTPKGYTLRNQLRFWGAGISLASLIPSGGEGAVAEGLGGEKLTSNLLRDYGDFDGRLYIINASKAGTVYRGVPWKPNEYPDFSGHLYQGGTNTVQIVYTGSRKADFDAANAAAGYTSTPAGYTWHHVEDMTTMQLVDSSIHNPGLGGVAHSGGVSVYESTFGVKYRP